MHIHCCLLLYCETYYEYGDVHVNLCSCFEVRLLTYVNNKGADQHAHPHSMINEFKLFNLHFHGHHSYFRKEVHMFFCQFNIFINGAAIDKRLQISKFKPPVLSIWGNRAAGQRLCLQRLFSYI